MKIPFWRSTRARLILLILLVAIPAFFVQGYGAWSDLQWDVSAHKQDAAQTATRAQGKFQTLLGTSRSVFSELVRLPEMRNLDNCILLFNDLRLAYERLAPDAINIGLSDVEGNIYCAVNPITGNINIAKQQHFQRAVKTLDMAAGDYVSGRSTLPTLNVAYPVLSFDGKVQTVIFITYEVNWLEIWQREVALPSDTVLTLISPNGDILRRYRDGAPTASKASAAQMEWYAPLQNGQSGIEAADMDGVTRYHLLVPLQSGSQTVASLHVGYPIAEIYTQAEQALAWRLTLLGIIFVVALGLAWWGSETLFMHPLNSLMRVVEKVQHGDLSARAASIPAVGELTGLAKSFDLMAESLQQRESAQQRAQFDLRESEARFRAMYDNAAVGMAMMSLERRIISMNQTAAIMTGYTLEELFNSDPSLLSYPDDVQVGMEDFRNMVAGKIPGFQMEKRFVRKGGEIFWGRVTYSVVPDKDGQPEYLVGIIEDVTEQREARQKLAEQEAEYRRTLEQRVEERTYDLAEANLRLMDEIEQRKRAEEALALKAAEDAVTAERTRLARDLHDAVTQTLFSASIVAEILPQLWEVDPEEAKRSTDELGQLTRGALAEMRTLLLELRPAALTQSRLNELIRQLCEALIGRARLPIKFISEGDRTLPPEVQVAFYRIAQEGLNNVFKYARATQVTVGLFLTPAGAHLEVCDNGVGFDVSAAKPTSLGMRIMRERADAIGAELSINSKPGEGVCLDLTWTERPDMKLSVFKS
jgi:PAS domain S-box-containing protein